MRYGSVCSGIEAATVAWHGLGWSAAWYSEIEPFPCAVLAHHYPDVPNHGDMTTLPARIRAGEVEAPDLFCGGTPCQAFSVAGLRQSLADARGNLSLVFCEVANAIDAVRSARGDKPCIVFWENVPGVLSTADNAFGCFLAGLAGETVPLEPPGRRWTDAGVVLGPTRAVAWRVLDAQYFGVAQRRRRVFVVASARDDFDCAAVLFEREGLRRDTAPSRTQRETATAYAAGGIADYREGIGCLRAAGGDLGGGSEYLIAADVVGALCADTHPGSYSGQDAYTGRLVAHTLTGNGYDASEDGTGRGTPIVLAHAFDARQSDVGQYGDVSGTPLMPVGVFQESEFGVQQYDSAGTLRAGRIPEHQMVMQPVAIHPTQDPIFSTVAARGYKSATDLIAHAFDARQSDVGQYGDLSGTLDTDGHSIGIVQRTAVRRLTPRECERLQGFPDDYTAIPYKNKPADDCPDGPRYRALGNSWAVPVVRWIGQRIADATNPQSPPTVGATA